MFDQPTLMTVQSRFTNSFFEIPRYQRPYTWDTDEVYRLLDDIENSDIGYFIGSTIFYKSESEVDTFEIVDGQQRITTISMVISVMAELYSQLENEAFANSVLQKLIEGEIWKDSNNLAPKIRIFKKASDQETQSYFAQNILKVTLKEESKRKFENKDLSVESKRLQRNRKFITDYLKDLIGFNLPDRGLREKREALEEFKNKLLAAQILTIAATDFNEAYTIFRTLNSTGRDLSLSDLIKSSLLKYIPESAGLDSGNNSWSEIIGGLEAAKSVTPRLNIDDFFYYSWITRGNQISKKSNFYGEFDKDLNDDNASMVMNNFLFDAKIYELIFAGRERYSGKELNVDRAIRNLRRFGVTQYAPFLLVLIRDYLENKNGVSNKEVKKAISILERFHFQYNAVTKSPGNRISKIYPRTMVSLIDARSSKEVNQVIENLGKELFHLQPAKANFVEGFRDILYYNEKNIGEKNRKQNDIARYSLERYYLENGFNSFGKNLSELTVEHLIPQSLGSRRKNARNRYIGTLGNLIFLTSEDNGAIGDISIEEKIKYFVDNSIDVPTYVIENEYTAEFIYKKTDEIAEFGLDNYWYLKEYEIEDV